MYNNAITDAWNAAVPETRQEFIKQIGLTVFLDAAAPEDRAEFIRFASNTNLVTK